jgi:hypothetical protein
MSGMDSMILHIHIYVIQQIRKYTYSYVAKNAANLNFQLVDHMFFFAQAFCIVYSAETSIARSAKRCRRCILGLMYFANSKLESQNWHTVHIWYTSTAAEGRGYVSNSGTQASNKQNLFADLTEPYLWYVYWIGQLYSSISLALKGDLGHIILHIPRVYAIFNFFVSQPGLVIHIHRLSWSVVLLPQGDPGHEPPFAPSMVTRSRHCPSLSLLQTWKLMPHHMSLSF